MNRLTGNILVLKIRFLMIFFRLRQIDQNVGWRDVSQETYVLPYLKIYTDACFPVSLRIFNGLLHPWAWLLKMTSRRKKIDKARVSGVYYPMD